MTFCLWFSFLCFNHWYALRGYNKLLVDKRERSRNCTRILQTSGDVHCTRWTNHVGTSSLVGCKQWMLIHPSTKPHSRFGHGGYGKIAAGVWSIRAELLKGWCVTMIPGLTAVWYSGAIPLDWRTELIVLMWKGKRDCQTGNFVFQAKIHAYLLLMRIRRRLLKSQRSKKSGFKPANSANAKDSILMK